MIRGKQILHDVGIAFSGGDKAISNLLAGVLGTDAVNKNQLDAVEALIAGLEWQDSAIADIQYIKTTTGAPTTTGATTGELLLNTFDDVLYTSTSGDTWDAGSALSDGDRYIFKESGTGTGTGITPTANNNIYASDGGTTTPTPATSPTTGMFISIDDDASNLWYYGGASWASKTFENTTVADTSTIDLTIAAGQITADLIANSVDESYLNGLGTGTSGQTLQSDGSGGFQWVSVSDATHDERKTENAALATSSDEDDAVVDIFGAFTPRAETVPMVYVNGILVTVGDGVKTKDCYFAAAGTPGTAISFASLTGNEDLQWNGSVAGYELDTSDVIECHFSE